MPLCALVAQFLTFLLTLVCWLDSIDVVFKFGRLFLADVQSSRIELWGVSGPGVNIIVHSQTQLKTRTEGLTLQTSLAWLIIWTTLKDGDGDSPKGVRRGGLLWVWIAALISKLRQHQERNSAKPSSHRSRFRLPNHQSQPWLFREWKQYLISNLDSTSLVPALLRNTGKVNVV